ncbi:hypothetical protein TSUD_155670 [Trifolium subterraneum]|uniref:Reverse transcriptase domain-containing protein n=1 Tax=Trifolium subterraneum TaxID=3900 RepID=A0A2Z6MTU1_TRISU|nr:hypothetical protein TSUD_155670 [Trifolium subterraneum]
MNDLKKIARLSEVDRNALIRSLKKSNKKKGPQHASKATSGNKQGTFLSGGSDQRSNSNSSLDWKNWVTLHGNTEEVVADIVDIGKVIGVECSNSFQVLSKGGSRGGGPREGVVMKIFSFNIRGLGAVEKRREVRRLISERRPDVFCIQETKLEVVDNFLCRSLWGSDVVAFSFKPSVGASGGILTMWDTNKLDVWTTINMSSCLIVHGKFVEDHAEFWLANVYAPCNSEGRALLWNDLSDKIQRNSNVAWCVLGDFNAVRSFDERISRSVIGGSDVSTPFNQFIDDNCLIDLPLNGRNFTWYRGDGSSMSRLDRFLLSECWITLFPNCFQAALPRDVPGYTDFVRENWQSFRIHGWSGFIIKEKLKMLKEKLRWWHFNHTVNIDSKLRNAKNRLEVLDVIGESRVLQWQKSRVNWLKEGDANTKFFHGVMAARKRSNSIVSLTSGGVNFEGVAEVRQMVFEHFKNHFRRSLPRRPDIGGLLFNSLSMTDGADLIKPFLLDEIKAAIRDCDSFKCPGPDGINIGFFKDFWELLKIEVLNFFADFHRNGKLTKGLNSTFIALIPKVDNPQRVADFRPIALVSSVYKILSKVLANRLRNVIGTVVSSTQSAFIKGRQILDGILIANEIVDNAKRERKDLLMFKVDFEKAYDSVDWGYLNEVMAKMNFPVLCRLWIMECVTTATTSVLVNGSPTDEFCFERGLRQGDPLSPFLFLLAAEGLNVMMSAMISKHIFTPYVIGHQNSVSVSHLQFADDTLLVGTKSWANIRALKAVLILFESISGLKVNFNKSMLVGVNVNDSWLHEAASVMNCKHGKLPFLYLGLPIGGDPRKLQFWYPLVDRIRKRVIWAGKDNLHKRNVIDDTQLSCATMCGALEDRNHLFFQCDVYGRVWPLVSKWLGYESAFHGTIEAHSTQFSSLGGVSARSHKALSIIWLSVLFVIWKDRNNQIFHHKSSQVQALSEKVKLHTYWWLKSHYLLFDFDYSCWRSTPLACFKAIV